MRGATRGKHPANHIEPPEKGKKRRGERDDATPHLHYLSTDFVYISVDSPPGLGHGLWEQGGRLTSEG